MKRLLFAFSAAALAIAPSLFAATDTDTTTLSVTVAPEASITVTANPTLTSSGTEFANYTGTTSFTFREFRHCSGLWAVAEVDMGQSQECRIETFISAFSGSSRRGTWSRLS